MERLTYRDSTVPHTNAKGELWEAYSDRNYNEVINKLAAYEDSGLEPETVKNWMLTQDLIDSGITPAIIGTPLKHLFELAKAEADGRLVILPCKVGDTIYLLERFFDGPRAGCNSWVVCKECDDYKQKIISRRIVSIDEACAIIGMLGKTVFLTREEAEVALRGVE